MVQLIGNNLPKRQHDLNVKVNQAATNNSNFEEIRNEAETSDVDRLFKIDLATKCKNIDYIIETLKSGDSLYISRALKKATWLYDEEHSDVINTDYLHHHIFPSMSIKMKKKLLTAISFQMKNENRAADFYNYCLQLKISDLAYKFALYTSESFKLKLLEERVDNFTDREEKYMKGFIRDSFEIFNAYLKQANWKRNSALKECSYLYTVSDVRYLQLLEKYATIKSSSCLKLGIRISKDIIVKHKDRVLANPKLYVNILNITKLLRHSTWSDVKLYAVGLMPATAAKFWDMNYYSQYKPIINAIPEGERFTFLKKIFNENYNNEEFEMLLQFYNQEYHILMTDAEREAWALRHIANGKEILGSGLDYTWYGFVSFDKAFEEIKKIIRTATDQAKRLHALKILAQSAKTQRELERLFKYYYERHVNENRNITERFLNKVITIHNALEFDTASWEEFNKILYSIDVYSVSERRCNQPNFMITSILYHILHDKELPEVLNRYLELEISMHITGNLLKKLEEVKKEKVYMYIYNFYLLRIQKSESGSEDPNVPSYVHFILELMAVFKKTKNDIPELVMEIVQRDPYPYRYQQILEVKAQKTITVNDLVRDLKVDLKLVCNKISNIIKDQIINNWDFSLKTLLRKLKIYFSNDDITKDFITLFNILISNQENFYIRVVYTSVYGILELSDEKSKIDFMNKFVPDNPKIDNNLQEHLLRTREAICRFACYSRPPVPLSNILMYLKGDYVHFCLPMFNMYLANLPLPLCLKFVESLLDAPVSIQKHGLRLAFKCFSTENLRELVLNTWKNTKNVSLRGVIYKAFFEKTVNELDKEMYNALKLLTLDLHDEDSDDIFQLLTSDKLTDDYTGDFIETVWATVEKFKDNDQNISRKTNVIKHINDRIYLINKNAVKKIVLGHVNTVFNQTASKIESFGKCDNLCRGKWDLTAHYLIYFTSTEEDISESIEITKLILSKCFAGWSEVISDVYVNRRMCAEFISNLKDPRFVPHPKIKKAVLSDTKSYINAIPVFEAILNELQTFLPLHEIYIYVWELRITVLCRKVIKEMTEEFHNDTRMEVIEEAAVRFGRQLGRLVTEFVEKKMYFSYFTDNIKGFVTDCAFDIKNHFNSDVNKDHYLVGIARGLLETKTVETGLLAFTILPVEPNCNIDFYRAVFDEIRKIPDMEVKCCLYQEYSGDFKRRRFE